MAAISRSAFCVTLPHFRWRKCPLEPCMDPSGLLAQIGSLRSDDRSLVISLHLHTFFLYPSLCSLDSMIPYPFLFVFPIYALCFAFSIKCPKRVTGIVRYLRYLLAFIDDFSSRDTISKAPAVEVAGWHHMPL